MEQEIRLYDLYDIWYEPFWVQRWFVVMLSILFFFALGFFMYWLMLKRRKKHVLSSSGRALAALKELNTSVYVNNGKQFYTELCTIIKNYLQERYSINLTDKSDHEIMLLFQTRDDAPEVAQQLETVLYGAVTIKFAQHKAAQEQMAHDLQTCILLVEKTQQPQS
jgi:hypothetical protein